MSKNLNSLKKVAIVQARYGSTRLPGKILKEISGKPILWHVVNRLSYSKLINSIVISTTTLEEDNQTEALCLANKFDFFRGSSENVLSRYYETAKQYQADIIIRVTSDCPLIDPIIIDKMLKQFLEEDNLDYMSNVLERTFPRGLDTEIFTFSTLERAYNEATKEYEREHVTSYIYQHSELFNINNYPNEKNYSEHRWTVDTQEDLNLIKEIYKNLYKPNKIFLLNDVLALFDNKPELMMINQNIRQKKIGE